MTQTEYALAACPQQLHHTRGTRYTYKTQQDPRTRACLAEQDSLSLRDKVGLLCDLLAPMLRVRYNCQGKIAPENRCPAPKKQEDVYAARPQSHTPMQ